MTEISAGTAEVHMHGDAALEAVREVIDGTEDALPTSAQAVVDHFGDATDIDASFEEIFAAAVAEQRALNLAERIGRDTLS